MSIELLSKNIEREVKIIEEIVYLYNRLDFLVRTATTPNTSNQKEKEHIINSINSLSSQFKILNNAIPDLLNSTPFYKKLEDIPENKPDKPIDKTNLINVKYFEQKNEEKPVSAVNVAIKKEDEKKFLHNLSSYRSSSKKIKKEENLYKYFNSYIAFANKFFRNISNRLIEKGYFNSLKIDLRKSTSQLLINSYISMMFFSTALSIIVSFFICTIFVLFGLSIGISLLIFLLIPILIFFLFYFYPSSKRKSLEKDINQELPFMTIYIAAIATSGIEPSKIFEILVSSKEYPAIQREIKKLNNYINFYGYDLVSALRAVSKNNPSELFSQLLDGLATTVTSGGSLIDYLNKHSESLLFDYRLEREKYTRIAETFMNIYISIVIAAPMIMVMLFVLMSLTGFGSGYLSPFNIGAVTILVISALNLVFLLILNIKQPKF